MNAPESHCSCTTFYARILDKTYPFNLSVSAIVLNKYGELILD